MRSNFFWQQISGPKFFPPRFLFDQHNFGPKYLTKLISLIQNFFDQIFFCLNFHSTKFFLTKIFFYKNFLGPIFFLVLESFRPRFLFLQHIFGPKLFFTIFFYLIFLDKFFVTKISSGPTCMSIFWGPLFYWDQHFYKLEVFWEQIFGPIFF